MTKSCLYQSHILTQVEVNCSNVAMGNFNIKDFIQISLKIKEQKEKRERLRTAILLHQTAVVKSVWENKKGIEQSCCWEPWFFHSNDVVVVAVGIKRCCRSTAALGGGWRHTVPSVSPSLPSRRNALER